MKRRACHRGFTLVRTMVGMALGLIVVLAALATFQLIRDGYTAVADDVLIEERGLRALGILSHAVRQAGWIPEAVAWQPAHPSPVAPVEGRDDCARPAIGAAMSCGGSGVLKSDALLLRVSGSGLPDDPTLPDGTMSDCGGYALPARAIAATAGPATTADDGAPAHHAATNAFYIGLGNDGVPQLLCRYPSRQGQRVQAVSHTAGTLVRGVESLQLRYGVDADDDGKVDRFVQARTLQAEDSTAWHRVRAVQIVVVVRGDRPTMAPNSAAPLTLFPEPATAGEGDDLSLRPAMHPRFRRRVFATTVRLRNPSPCREALC